MFSSRNIHFAILGIILGAATGYIFAFVQVHRATPREVPKAANSGVPAGHPDVKSDEILTMFKEALAKSPNDTALMTRYANFLFDLGRFNEAVGWFGKVLAIDPNNLDTRTDMATALWSAGQKDRAMSEYQQILARDPRHMPTLHNLVIVHFEERDLAAAERVIRQMESIDSKYEGLEPLKKRLSELK